MFKQFVICLLVLFSIGCGSMQKAKQHGCSASYLGDYRSYSLDSFVVSVKNADNELMNLHISFTAVVNPKERFLSSTTYSDLRYLIRKLETRMKAQLITKTLSLNPNAISNSLRLHKVLTEEAQSIFDKEYLKWKKASYFDVKIVITSLYFTDLSVGKTGRSRRWW